MSWKLLKFYQHGRSNVTASNFNCCKSLILIPIETNLILIETFLFKKKQGSLWPSRKLVVMNFGILQLVFTEKLRLLFRSLASNGPKLFRKIFYENSNLATSVALHRFTTTTSLKLHFISLICKMFTNVIDTLNFS